MGVPVPAGKAYIRKARIALNLRFPGQYYDQETGLHYNYFRDYDPAVGRYLTRVKGEERGQEEERGRSCSVQVKLGDGREKMQRPPS